MDLERALISKIVSTGQLEMAISKGIRGDLFFDEECRDLFEYLSDYIRRYKQTPTPSIVKTDRPTFELQHHMQEPLEWIIDRFIVWSKRRLAAEYVQELAKAVDDDGRAENIDLEFLEVSRKLATLVPSDEVLRFSDMEKRIDQYERDAKEGHKPGIPFGFPKLDEWTGGIQPHELVTISGFSGLGKSTLSMVIAHHAWTQGYTPLIISLEMEAKTMLRRFDAMAANLDYRKLKQLDLAPAQLENWREFAEQVKKSQADIPILDKIRFCTPDKVYAETVRHKPDLVVIDYITLMRSARPQARGAAMWQSVTEVTQDLKQNARTLGIPIIAMAQTNRLGGKEGAELDNTGYSLSIVQDSDIVIGLFANDEMKEAKEMEIRLNKNRDGRIGKFMAVWDHDTQEFREKTEEDLFKRRSLADKDKIKDNPFLKGKPKPVNKRKHA